MEPTVAASWCEPIAVELHRIAYDLGKVVNAQGDMPEPRYVHLHVQPGGSSEDATIAAVDGLGLAIAGKPGEPDEMSSRGGGVYHYAVEVQRGPVYFRVYREISTDRALRIIEERKAADKDAEITRLRARVAELELTSDLGLAYTRADDEPDDPTPVSGARVPAHTGGVTEGGLAEEVIRYFSFGHGQTDPADDSGKDLVCHYVTVIAPTAEACREAMLASRFGREWAFEYVPGTPQANEWIPRWTEYERIDAMPKAVTDEGLVDETLEIRPLDTERFGAPGMVTCSYCVDRVQDTDWLAHARTHDPQYSVIEDPS